jgi:CBS domain-containing protein
MSRDVATLPEHMSARAAADLLFQNRISGAPVVDRNGRCIGVLSATDLVRWAEERGHGAEGISLPCCPYQVKGRLPTGEEAVICILAQGNCPLQKMWPWSGGRHVAVCRQPGGVLCDWQQMPQNLPGETVRHHMTSDVVAAGPETPLPQLARMMIDAHIRRVIVVDEERKPIGIVSSTDLVAALAYATQERGDND